MKIFLIGMMGAGKTYWAQRLSARTGIDWIDLDTQVEKAVDMLVPEIFQTEGETFFRNKEREVLQQLSAFQDLIIATGGGTPAHFDNMEWMNRNGVTIWLDEPVKTLTARVVPGKQERPLISGLEDDGVHEFLEERLKERQAYYSRAHHRLQGENISEENLLGVVV